MGLDATKPDLGQDSNQPAKLQRQARKFKFPCSKLRYGPRRNKTCLLGFRKSEFQTSLLRYRD